MSVRELPDFKWQPKLIFPSLKIISLNQGNWKKIWTELVKMAKDKGYNAHEDNIVSAYITPGLRNLKLAMGVKEKLHLTPDGKQCLQIYEKLGENDAKKRLGYQIIKMDEEKANLIPYLLKHHNSKELSVSTQDLKQELIKIGIRGADKETRVPAWITLLEYVELIKSTKKGWYILESQYDAFKKGEKNPTTKEFAKVLQESKNELKYVTRGSPYIPIPELREHICDKLRISTFKFDDLISQFPQNYKGVRLVFATPMRKVAGGLLIGKKYYYFIGVFS